MNEIIKKLRFGFEIEGLFRNGMSERLNFRGDFVSDGSVTIHDSPFSEHQQIPVSTPRSCQQCEFRDSGELVRYCPTHHARYRREGQSSTEYASAVFDDLDSCLRDLRLFNKHNHAFNTSCGLHFHVGAKEDKWRQLFGVASNLQYIKQLHKEALHYCDCQKERLDSSHASHFCGQYRGRNELKNCTKVDEGNNEKYRFVRFHPQHHTLEFRFLSPCEHKIQNVRKLLASVTSYLGRSESHRAYAIAETSKREDAEIMHEIKIEKAVGSLDIVKQLHQPNPHETTAFYQDSVEFPKLAREYGPAQAAQIIHNRRMQRDRGTRTVRASGSGRFMRDVVYGDGMGNRYQSIDLGIYRLDRHNNFHEVEESEVPINLRILNETPFLRHNGRTYDFQMPTPVPNPFEPGNLAFPPVSGGLVEQFTPSRARELAADILMEMQANIFSAVESEEEE